MGQSYRASPFVIKFIDQCFQSFPKRVSKCSVRIKILPIIKDERKYYKGKCFAMEPDCLSLSLTTCFHGLLAATSKRHQLLVAATSRPQPLVAWLLPIGPDSNTFDNQPILANKERIDKETGLISVNVGTHQEMLNLNITETSIYDITFGLPWLKKHDLRISYKKEIIKFKNCECQPKPDV